MKQQQSARLRHILLRSRDWIRAQDTSDWTRTRQRLRLSCFPKQRGAFDDRSRRKTTRCGRGSGKTTVIRAGEIDCAMEGPGRQVLYFANNREQAERLMWSATKTLLEKLEVEFKPQETKLRLRLTRNDSEIQLAGLADKKSVEAWRGEPHDLVDFDECGSVRRELLNYAVFQVIEPRMGDRNGRLNLWGSPGRNRSVFYDTSRPGSPIGRPYADRDRADYADFVGWSQHHWNLTDGAPHVPALANLWRDALETKKRNGWGDSHPTWLREYLGEWAFDDSERMFRYRPHLEDGTEWNEWDPPRNPRGFAELPQGREWQFVYGMDLGTKDPFSLEIFAFSPTEGVLYHCFEYERRDMFARKIAQLLLGEELDHQNITGVLKDTGWPDGIVADAQHGGGTLLQELTEVYGIHCKAAKQRNKFDSIELFNGDLVEGRIKILKGSKLAEQLTSSQWAMNEYGELKEPKSERNDCTDAAVYARTEANHQFVREADPGKPPRGSRERDEYDAKAEEERAARITGQDNYDGLLGDDNYDSYFRS